MTERASWTERRHPTWLYRFLQIVTAPILRFFFATRRVGHKSIPKRGPAILVTNHVSNLDPILVVASIPRPIFHFGKHTLFTTRFRRWFFGTLGGQIPVNRDRGGNQGAIAAGLKVLEEGHALGIYPEGHRSPDGRLMRGKTGVARIALLSGAPIYPVAVDGTLQVWPKGQKRPKFFRRTRVLVGPPRAYAKDPVRALDDAELRKITDEVMSDLARLLGQDYDPERAPWPAKTAPTPANV